MTEWAVEALRQGHENLTQAQLEGLVSNHNWALHRAVEAERNRIVGIIADYEDTTQHGDTGSDAIRWILAEIERGNEDKP